MTSCFEHTHELELHAVKQRANRVAPSATAARRRPTQSTRPSLSVPRAYWRESAAAAGVRSPRVPPPTSAPAHAVIWCRGAGRWPPGTMLDEEAVPAPLTGMARYEKGIVLGEGTFGVVFKANDRLVRTPRSPCWRRRAERQRRSRRRWSPSRRSASGRSRRCVLRSRRPAARLPAAARGLRRCLISAAATRARSAPASARGGFAGRNRARASRACGPSALRRAVRAAMLIP
jgi:hypothetical protein